MSSLRHLRVPIQWALLVALAYLIALFVAWQLLLKVDFVYPLWYEVLSIEQTIARYGPQNRYREGFETTTKKERVRLFSTIVAAVHEQGKGLDKLVYHDALGHPIASLLTSPEIVHLQDVSRLLELMARLGWGTIIAWFALLGLSRLQRLPMPPLRILLLMAVKGLAGIAIIIVVLGPVTVFYSLHSWVFPTGHPWFFYYQDSLMTLLMKAPAIFGCIAVALAVLSFLLLTVILLFAKQLYQRI